MAFQLVDMMRAVLDEGTGAVVRQQGFQLPAAGKTGTTDDFNDAWFTGFTPTLSASVWVGFDRGASLRDPQGRGITGGRAAAPIWAEFMRRATEGEPRRDFPVPADIQFLSRGATSPCPRTSSSCGSTPRPGSPRSHGARAEWRWPCARPRCGALRPRWAGATGARTR